MGSISAMEIKEFFDKNTSTFSYIIYDKQTRDGVVLDSVLDYDPNSSSVTRDSLDKITQFLNQNEINLKFILESHVHADHMSASHFLKKEFPEAKSAIGSRVQAVQKVFGALFNSDLACDGSQFDLLLEDQSITCAGSLSFKTLACPGHTPACCSFLFGDCLFTGDVIFMPDFGTGRCDFPEGSAEDLFHSIQRLYQLPDQTKVFVGHDYCPGGRELRFQSTIGEEKKLNKHLRSDTQLEEFVSFRTSRDGELSAPRLLLPSLQVNLMAGQLPSKEVNGSRYLKIPLTGL